MIDIRKYCKTLVVACESRADKDRKPDVVKDYVETVINNNRDNPEITIDAGYATRLKEALMLCRTKDLEYLKQNNIDIVLDGRLGHQDVSFWGESIYAAFYNDSDQRTLSLWDNGKNETSFWSHDYKDGVAEGISKLVNHLEDNDIQPTDKVAFLGYYSRRSGKTTTHYYEWRSQDHFNQRAQKDNPHLLTAPKQIKPSASW